MKRLVIAEKPAVGIAIASVLGIKEQRGGYMEGQDYVVSWGIGHLVELASADSYDERYTKWRYDDLPIVPSHWKYKVTKDKYQQFELLKKLMNRSDISEVINACDAGREGELIFRNIYRMVGCQKPVSRLWISSMEDDAIMAGFRNLKNGREYDNLFAAARCREWADWIVGINATRLFSVLYHRTLNVGRVLSPTLSLLVQREAEIEAFKAEPFYTAVLDFGSFKASSEKFKEKAEADAVALTVTGTAVVESVVRKEKIEHAPALYDLTTLQRDANRILGYTAQQTMDYAQSLYEKKLCTYPRTDSRYLPNEMDNSIKAMILCAAGISNLKPPAVVATAQVCDSKKVSDHHAIVPTAIAGEADLVDLPVGEREILKLIARQVVLAVSEAYRYCDISVHFICGEHEFVAKGTTVERIGWKTYCEKHAGEKFLPLLDKGDTVNVVGNEVKEGTTQPPVRFTEDLLLSAMETAGAKETPADVARKGLGTPATRASIIEKLVSTGFVERKKGKKKETLVPARTGISLITVLPEQLQSPLLTAEWEHKLKMVEHGEKNADEFMAEICLMINNLVKTYTVIKGTEILFPSGREVVGVCPRCGEDVTESKKGFFCESNDCRFGLWRDNKYLSSMKITLTKKMVSTMLKDGSVPIKGVFSEKTGRSYDAMLKLTDDGTRAVYSLETNRP